MHPYIHKKSCMNLLLDVRSCVRIFLFFLQILKHIQLHNLNGFLKVTFPPKKSFLKYPFLVLHIKTLLQTNFCMVSKFAQHLHYFSDIDRLLKQIWPVWIFLNWCFHHKNSLITHSMWFKMSNFAEQHKYFSIFQQPDWVQQLDCEFDQDADFKKLVSYITAGVLIWWWV